MIKLSNKLAAFFFHSRLWRLWNQWKIARKFQVFFVLTAILPILIFCWIFFASVNERFQQRIENLLQSGRLFAQDFLIDNQNELELYTSQLANLSHADLIELSTQTEDPPVEFTIVFNASGQEIARYQPSDENTPPLAGIPYDSVVKKALAGETNSAIETLPTLSLRPDTAQHRLIYLAASPVYAVAHAPKKSIVRVVLVGKFLEPNREFRQLTSILPEDKFRFYEKTPTGFQLAFSNIQNDQNISTDPLQKYLTWCSQSSRLCETSTSSFLETFNEIRYTSKAFPILNGSGQAVGYLVVSTSKDDIAQLERVNFLMLAAFLVAALFFIILLGYWFESRIISPLQKLSDITHQVARGNFTERVPENTAESEIHYTIFNFNKMLDRLQENDRYRATFVSTLTHDLRTPLLAQKRVLQIILNELANSHVNALCQGLLKNNEQLLHMVNQLLSANEYEGGKVHLLLEPTHLDELVEDCLHELEALAHAKQIRLLNQIPNTVPMLAVDTVHVKRVFVNLIANALENIPSQGEVRIRCDQDHRHVHIIVEDTGQGVPADMLPHLFERYSGNVSNRKKIGTGLGLYICKMIMELHQGRISASCSDGGGLRFILTFKRPHPPLETTASKADFPAQTLAS